MIPRVRYISTHSAADAVSLMRGRAPKSLFLAGGTDVMVRMRNGKTKADCLVDVSGIRGLAGIRDKKGQFEIGALTTIEEIRRSPVVARELPALWESSNLFAAWQVRNLATLGGNLCNASPAADMVPPLMAYDAVVVAQSTKGERSIPIDQFFEGPGRTTLASGELVRRVEVPKPLGKSVFLKLGKRRASALAIVSVAARLKVEDGRITESRVALGSVAPTPIRAGKVETFLKGKPATEMTFEQASKRVLRDIRPISDIRASAAYRQDMAVYLTAKALKTAALEGGVPL